MRKWFKQLDDILRGAATEMPSLREGRIDMRLGGVVVVALLLTIPIVNIVTPVVATAFMVHVFHRLRERAA